MPLTLEGLSSPPSPPLDEGVGSPPSLPLGAPGCLEGVRLWRGLQRANGQVVEQLGNERWRLDDHAKGRVASLPPPPSLPVWPLLAWDPALM